MAYITLPSGKRIDTSHISYMTHHEHTTEPIWPATTGAIHRRRTLHMDNNDQIHLDGPDMDALDAALVDEVSSSLTPLGFQFITSLATSTPLTVPTGATEALIQVMSQNVRWRDDGVAPTATVGMQLRAGGDMLYTGKLTAIRFIEEALGASLNVSYYR